jgi:hypothetical protein
MSDSITVRRSLCSLSGGGDDDGDDHGVMPGPPPLQRTDPQYKPHGEAASDAAPARWVCCCCSQHALPRDIAGPSAVDESAESGVVSRGHRAAYDYGSPEANRAVEKLTKMGCIVHPPGKSEAADWGALAGAQWTTICFHVASPRNLHICADCTAACVSAGVHGHT